MQKRYLILTASYGSGHNAAKNAIENYLNERGDIVESIDMITLLQKGGENSNKFYTLSQKIPILWDAAFNILDTEIVNEMLNLVFKGIYQKKFNEMVNKFKPDQIICTFPNWPIFIKNYLLKYEKTFRTGVIITDAIEIGMPWFFSTDVVDEYFVIDKWSKEAFNEKFSHKVDNINISFFPIEEKYFTDKKELSNKRIIVLLTGLKKAFVNKFFDNLGKEEFYEKIIVCGGRNKKLFNQLKKEYSDKRFEFHEFPNIRAMLKDIDIFVAKPGGAIMAECIANDTLLFSPTYIPGQEEGNIKLLENTGTGFYEKDPLKIMQAIKYYDLNKFLPNFALIKNKDSVKFIIETLESK